MVMELYESYPAALDALWRKLGARRFSPDEYHVVLTPDRYTLRVETALFKGGGALDCEVLTLSRLCRRVLGGVKTLPREGSVMLAARAVAAVADKLKYYRRAAKYGDFAREAYAAILQTAASDVDITQIEASGATAAKLNDIALIKSEYDRLKADCLDAPDKLFALIEAAPESEFIRNTHFYAVGYKDATKLNVRVFSALAKYARSFRTFDVERRCEKSEKRPIVYRAPDAVTQYKAVAMRILDRVYKGGRFGDAYVVCADTRAALRIFDEYGIPCYTDEVTPLAETAPFCAVSDVYKLKTSGEAEALVSLCKNPFSGCAAKDAERLQKYIAEHGKKYGVLDGMEIDDFSARRAYDRAVELVGAFRGGFGEACAALVDFAAFEDIQRELYPGGTDMITPLRATAALLDSYGSGDLDTDASAFFAAARSVDVKSLPRRTDCVMLTDASALRLTRCKNLYVTDFDEGVMPPPTAETGLLSDFELERMGSVIEPTAREKNRRDRDELFAVMNNADEIFCAYYTANGGKRATFLQNFDVPDTADELAYDEECAVLAQTDDVSRIVMFAQTATAARELAARRMTKYADAVLEAAGGYPDGRKPFERSIGAVPCDRLSVSELTNWFYCPYKRFLANGVGLKERRRGELSAPDFGTVLHEFMKIFVERGASDCSRETVGKIIDGILDGFVYELSAVERERIVSDAVRYAQANKTIIESGSYKPIATEYAFGGSGGLKLGKVGAQFTGVIDRIDGTGDRVRVIDYKTGNKKFDRKLCLCGVDMQLPLYAAALGTDKTVTGIFYVPLKRQYDDGDGRMSGCMVKNISYAAEYDAKLAEGLASDVVAAKLKIGKDGTPEGFSRPGKNLVESDEFRALTDTCVRTAGAAADEIAGGYIDRAPCLGACERCAFGAVCGSEKRVRSVDVSDEDLSGGGSYAQD